MKTKTIIKRWLFFLIISLSSFISYADNQTLLNAIDSNRWEDGKKRQYTVISLIENNQHLSDMEKINLVNDFYNDIIVFENDLALWNNIDYWASPLETLNRGAGDCEDFAIIKYFTLLKLGIDYHKLRFFYVKYYNGSNYIAHMVLAYSNDNSNFYILDNINKKIMTSRERTDLIPVFSFNQESIFVNNNNMSNNISKWKTVYLKAKKEGF